MNKRSGSDQVALPEFQKNLKMILDQRKLTALEMGEHAGVHRSVIYSWLSGTAPRDLNAVAKLAKALKISFYNLLFGESEPKFDKPPVVEQTDPNIVIHRNLKNGEVTQLNFDNCAIQITLQPKKN